MVIVFTSSTNIPDKKDDLGKTFFGPTCTKRSWPEKNILGHRQNLFTYAELM